MTERGALRILAALLAVLVVCAVIVVTGCTKFETIGVEPQQPPGPATDPVELCQWTCEEGTPWCEIVGDTCTCGCGDE